MKLKSKGELKNFDKELSKLKFDALYLEIFKAIKNRDKIEGENNSKIDIYVFDKHKHPAPFWRYDKRQKKHIVAVPREDILNDKAKVALCHSFFHELSHAIHSGKNISEVAAKAKKEGVPFDYVNIFEDMRIERLIENYLKKPIFKYSEDKYGAIDLKRVEIKPSDEPFKVLYKMLMFAAYHTSKAYSNIHFIDIKSFCDRAVNAKNTDEVANIAIEFYKKYKNMLPQQKEDRNNEKAQIEKECGLGGEGNQSSQDESDIDISDEQIEDILNDSETKKIENKALQKNEQIDLETEKIPMSPPNKRDFNIEETNNYTNQDLINLNKKDLPKEIDADENFIGDLKKIKQEVEKLKVEKKKNVLVKKFKGKKINTKGALDFITGINYDAKVMKEERKEKKKFPNLHLFVDLSGSMFGYPIDTAKTILIALNELVNKQDSNIYITFSRDNYYQTIKLPINPTYFFHLKAPGSSEGISQALKINQPLLDRADKVLFITDMALATYEFKSLKKYFKKNQEKAFIIYANKSYTNIVKDIIERELNTKNYFLSSDRVDLVKDLIIAINSNKISPATSKEENIKTSKKVKR